MTLNPKQARFVTEYLVDLNGAAAAIRAGYSENRAKQAAYELLEREDVKAAIDELQAKRSAEAGDRATRAAQRLEDIALMELADPIRATPATLLNVVRAASVDLLKLDGKFAPEKHEHSGPDGGPIEVTDLEAARRIAFILTRATKQDT